MNINTIGNCIKVLEKVQIMRRNIYIKDEDEYLFDWAETQEESVSTLLIEGLKLLKEQTDNNSRLLGKKEAINIITAMVENALKCNPEYVCTVTQSNSTITFKDNYETSTLKYK